MALTNLRTRLPPFGGAIDSVLNALRVYLLERDFGIPSNLPSLLKRTTTPLVTVSGQVFELDRLTWAYEQPNPNRGRIADGFLLYIQQGTVTGEPSDNIDETALKISSEARAFVAPMWPSGTIRNYAIAAYRNSHQGEQRTERVTGGAWVNVS